MSKIQDALNKIQRQGTPPASAEEKHAPLGRVNETIQTGVFRAGDDDASDYCFNRYRGPKIELDIEEIRNAGLLGPADKERELQDEYRQIKRPLLRNIAAGEEAIGEAANVIMVCSAESGEGKSFTSINLSFSLAVERDIEVLLVDADILKPQISSLFGLADRPGLTDLLENSSLDPDDVVSPTDIPGFAVLPAGAPHRHGTELLSSQRMHRLASDYLAKSTSRVVVIDSSPLLQTTEAMAMTRWAGQIVLVVKAGHTERSKVLQTMELLDQDKAINLVLNQAGASRFTAYYGYGYPYGGS